MKPVDIFHLGPQKTATTWVYQCLKEHPQVVCPVTDATHYFSMYYHRGREWYSSLFPQATAEQKLFDPTYSHLRSPVAPARIAKENPEAKFVVCLRHPIDRAFSHYWHEKKKRRYNFEFSEVLNNFDLFANWLETGFYAVHIERYLQYFNRSQILCQLFDDLHSNSRAFLQQLLTFIEIDIGFTPSVMNRIVNPAQPQRSRYRSLVNKKSSPILDAMHLRGVARSTKMLLNRSRPSLLPSRHIETLRDVPQEILAELEYICEPEIVRTEELLGLDLTVWRRRFVS